MKHFLLLFIFIFSFLCSQAQQEEWMTISGVILDDLGEPIPGVNVYRKDKTIIGTNTNFEGYYELKVPVGSTIVIMAVGFGKREFVALPENFITNSKIPPPPRRNPENYRDSTGKLPKHIGNMEKAKKVRIEQNKKIVYHKIRNIKYNPITKKFKIKTYHPNSNPLLGNFRLGFTSLTQFSYANRLPELQSQFAQGRPIAGESSWQGAETNEVFSWGPALNTLVYDGSPTPYQRNGNLISQASNPNGQTAQSFNAQDFFGIGLQTRNYIDVEYEKNKFAFHSSLSYRNEQGILHQNQREEIAINLNVSQKLKTWTLKEKIVYSNNQLNLPLIANNWQQIIGAIWRTPTSFDNSAGQNTRNAKKDRNTYRLNDGSLRSFAPNTIENPLGLINNLPDEQNTQNFLAQITLNNNRAYGKSDYYFNIAYQNQNQDRSFGFPNITDFSQNFRAVHRNYHRQDFSVFAHYYKYIKGFNINGNYRFNYQKEEVNRQNTSATEENIIFDRDRMSHSLYLGVSKSIRDFLGLYFTNKSYISSTLDAKDYAYFLPYFEVSLDFNELLYLWDGHLSLEAKYNKGINEAPLVQNTWQYNSLFYDAETYEQYFESEELPFQNSLRPSINHNYNLGLNTSFDIEYDINLSLSINYFLRNTQRLIVPIQDNNTFILENMADIRNQGWEASFNFDYRFYINSTPSFWKSSFHFTRFRPTVRKLNTNDDSIALAGYQDIQTALIEGEAFPAILGTAYLRNDIGQVIIDNDGFPQVNPSLQVIGNPNPDWILSWNNNLKVDKFSLSCIFEYRRGGDIWNGTQNVLNYFGMSQESAEKRSTENFIYEGVLADGTPNTIPVDFANPANGLEGNRWQRYGFAGVGEEAIQDASSLRLSEIALTFNASKPFHNWLRYNATLEFSIFMRNLLLWTKYTGIDPDTRLMNYNYAQGLDLFNPPNTSTIGFSVDMKL